MGTITNIIKEWVDTNVNGYTPSEGQKAIFDDIRKFSYQIDGVNAFDIIYKTLIDSKSNTFTVTIDRFLEFDGKFEKIKTVTIPTSNKPVNMSTGERVDIEEGAITDEEGNITGYKDGYCSVHQAYILSFRTQFESVYDGTWDRFMGI